MPRRITSATSLENLRKEAKRWLKELRAENADARARFERAYPGAPVNPGLRDVQHALAHEYGHESWSALKQALGTPAAATGGSIPRARTADEYRPARARARPRVRLARRGGAAAAQRPLRAVVYVRRSLGRDLAPRLRVPAAGLQRTEQQSPACRSANPHRAGCGLWKLESADGRGGQRRAGGPAVRNRSG